MTGRAVLHIGTPKSGTTFLQRALWAQRETLAGVGVHLPGERAQDMFAAAIELRGTHRFWGRDPRSLEGTWDRLCDEARAAGATTIMSHELLSAATPPQVSRTLSGLHGLEVDIVITVRDLGRQLMSNWQEDIKNGRSFSFADYQDDMLARLRSGDLTSIFWRAQDVRGQLDRWGAGLAPERVHVVVAPPSGSPPEVLWQRFAAAAGFDPATVDPPDPGERVNETLGMEQVYALRRINLALDGRVRNPQYARLVKRQLSQRHLAAMKGTRPVCPPSLVEELRDYAERTNEFIRERGYRVHGDLDELLTPRAEQVPPHPDEVSPETATAVLADLVSEMVVERARGGRGPGRKSGSAAGLRRRLAALRRRIKA